MPPMDMILISENFYKISITSQLIIEKSLVWYSYKAKRNISGRLENGNFLAESIIIHFDLKIDYYSRDINFALGLYDAISH
jgi:hypothetical protein